MRNVNRKERPLCRQAIHKLRIRPYLEDRVWDNRTYLIGDDPQPHSAMTDGLRVEMCGRWPRKECGGPVKIVRKLWYDGERYKPMNW